jgi:hypothetical protein
MRMPRVFIGFVHRVVYATLFALLAWHACTWPFGNSLVQRRIATAVCYTFDFPIAIVGRVTSPYRGIDVFFDRGEWCETCPWQQELWVHVRFAVPVYVVLFYIPTLVLWVVRRWRSKANHEHVTGVESAGHV